MRATALAARAFSDTPKKDLDLHTNIITNAVRLFRRMTHSESRNDRMASRMARQYITHEHPPKANGPIAIIFNYVHECGATIDEQFWVQIQHETRINTRHGPIQTVEEAVRRACRKHNIGQAEEKRKRINGAAQTIWTLIMADISKHNEEDQLTLRAIMSAGMCDKHLLYKAGLALDSKCERCGKERDDIFHRFLTIARR